MQNLGIKNQQLIPQTNETVGTVLAASTYNVKFENILVLFHW